MIYWRKLLLIIVLTLILLLTGACGTNDGREDIEDTAVSNGENGKGKIAFVSDRDGNQEIYVMNTDGSEQINLTNNASEDNWPTMSPDGKMIAFYSMRNEPNPESCGKYKVCNSDIYITNIDGTGLIQLTDMPGSEAYPSWSPDGSKITFWSNIDGQWDICIMNSDSSNLMNLTNDEEWDLFPAWKTDDLQVVFLSVRDGLHYCTVNTEGTSLNIFERGVQFDAYDVQYLAITEDFSIYIILEDTIETFNSSDFSLGEFPSWSPDGTRIAFYSPRDGSREIFVMNADFSNLIRLTNNSAEDSFPVWSPDGSQIAFQSDRDGNMEIYVMNADGSNLINLTNNPADDTVPAWYP